MEECKYLYQYMRDFPEIRSRFATDWAKKIAAHPNAAPGLISEELAAILRRRNELQADVVSLANFYKCQNDKTEFVELSRQTREYLCKELDTIFTELCRTLDAEGATLTGGHISALKRAGLPEHLAGELDALKREHLASIPEAERLGDSFAAVLYNELQSLGLISGPYAAFFYYLGQVTGESQETPGEGLKWTGNKAEFAYFARLFAQHTQPGGIGQPYIREKALCLAFGFDDRQRVNTIRPYLSNHHEPRTSAKIKAAFVTALETSTTKKQ